MPTGPTGDAVGAGARPRRPARARAGRRLGGVGLVPQPAVARHRATADRPAAAAPAGGGWRAGADGWAEGKHAAQIVAEPVRGDHTAAGLPVRVPRANLIPGSAVAATGQAAAATADGARRQPPGR